MSTTNTIVMHIMGGLGNQLFQIFTGLNYAIEHGTPIQFPYKKVVSENPYRESYWSTLLKSIEHLATTIDTNRYYKYFVHYFEYKDIPLFNKDICLQGYFQSYRYFEKHFETICKMIKLDEQKEVVFNKYKDYFFTTKEIISIHFRLGDYIKQQDCHPVLPITYYRNALSQYNIETSYRVLYFCEAIDNDTVSKSIQILQDEFKNIEFIKVLDIIVDWEQMLIMANCTHNIIANSSFSWWGAYFNKNINKKVIYPDEWFGSCLKYNTKDMCPITWTHVNVK